MPPTSPSAELFGFSEPIVKNGEVLVPLRTVGGFANLHGPKSLLVDLAHAILHVTSAPSFRIKAQPALGGGERQVSGRKISPERRALLDAAVVDWEEGRRTQQEVALSYGISFSAFTEHRCRRKFEAKSSERAPVTKPSGGLL